MPNVDELEKRLRSIEQEISHAKGIIKVLGVGGVSLLALMGYVYKQANSVDAKAKSAEERIGDAEGNAISNIQEKANEAITEALEMTGTKPINISIASGKGTESVTQNTVLESRWLFFNKKQDAAALRISYTDNMRPRGLSTNCRYEILIDGQRCPSGRLIYDYHVNADDNPHRSRNVIGYCEGISVGRRNISIAVEATLGKSFRGVEPSCSTGWNNSTWVIEVMELFTLESDIQS